MQTIPLRFLAVLALAASFFGCAKSSAPGETSDGAAKPASAPASSEDFVQLGGETTPEERRYLEFGRTVMLQLAARDYAGFHGALSSHAVARMSLNQFAPAEDDAVFQRHEQAPRTDVALPEFLELMAAMEKARGQPAKAMDLHVFSADPGILAGVKKEDLDALEIMFAIGNMPPLAPASIRRASLRGQIGVKLTPKQLTEAAEAADVSPEELDKDPEFAPYLNVKLVLVEETPGQLRVGYFEFLPPSMLD